MSGAEFLSRPCPGCGSAIATREVASSPKAEDMGFGGLRSYWSGLFKQKVFFSYYRCPDCRLLYTPHYFTTNQLGELYADMAPNMEVVPTDALEATQRGYWDFAKANAPMEGGYLEIGPDIGFVARHAATEGRFDHFWLFEPNLAVHPVLADAVKGRPHTLSAAMTDLSAVPDGSIGLAFIVHVLDHLLEPKAMLEEILRKLRPDGALVIVTHNEASFLRHAMKTRWPPFCLQHPELYRPSTMQKLVEKAGFARSRVERSLNYFPLSFMIRQAGFAVGLNLDRLPLPNQRIGLKLGNMITVAYR